MDVMDAARFTARIARKGIAAGGLVGRIAGGALRFARTGITPLEAYSSMRRLYVATNGRFNDVIARALRFARPVSLPPRAEGLLGSFGRDELYAVARRIDDDGFYVFGERLPPEMCDALERFARSQPCTPLVTRAAGVQEQVSFARGERRVYDSGDATVARWDFSGQQLSETEEVQRLLMDESVLSVARAYLGQEPIQDMLAMWWSTPRPGGEASSSAAQLFHFDMDRLRFLKLFVYLTDVTADDGPHVYVRGSRRRKPRGLLRDGRIGDDEIARYFRDADIVELTGPRGTIFAADTRGFHKGKPPRRNERLIFQMQFSISLFGQAATRIRLNERHLPEVRQFARAHRRLFALYDDLET